MEAEKEIKIMEYCDTVLSYLDKNKTKASVNDLLSFLGIPAQFENDIVDLLVNNEHVIKTAIGQSEYLQITDEGSNFMHTSSYKDGWQEQLLDETQNFVNNARGMNFGMSTFSIVLYLILIAVIIALIIGSK